MMYTKIAFAFLLIAYGVTMTYIWRIQRASARQRTVDLILLAIVGVLIVLRLLIWPVELAQ